MESAAAGKQILAVNNLLLQFLVLFAYLIDGFAYAAEALTGKFIGASRQKELRLCVICLFRWGRTLALVFVILYFIAQENILYLLTDDRQIIAAAGDYIIWTIILPLSGYSAYLWDGIYVGATASRTIRNAWYSPFSVFLSPLTLSVSSIWAIMRSGWHWSCSCSHVVFPARRSGKNIFTHPELSANG